MTLRTISTAAVTDADPYVRLAAGVLRQAVRDARSGNQEAIRFLAECDDFLALLDVDPGYFRRKMTAMCG